MTGTLSTDRFAPGRFLRFHLSSLISLVMASSVICACIHLVLVARNEARESGWHVLYGLALLDTSSDQKVQVSRSNSGLFVCTATTGRKLFTVELLSHPFDGHLYAINRYVVPEGAPRWQRWNERSSRWEPADEGLLLALAHVARALLKLVVIALVSSCLLCYWLRHVHWIRGVAFAFALVALAFVGLTFVPITWSEGYPSTASLNSDGSLLATANYNGRDTTVCVWDVANGRGAARIDLANLQIDALAFSADDAQLEMSSSGRVMQVYPLSTTIRQ